MPTNNSIPEVRSFQFDDAGLQNLSNCANLFRGDINLAQKLFTLPARMDNHLDVQVSLLYQSNIYQQAITNNLDAPTSVVGLGWSLPLEYIELDTNDSGTSGLWTYNFWSNGIPNKLIENPTNAALTSLDMTGLGTMQNNVVVPLAFVTAMNKAGLTLSAQAISNQLTDNSWLLEDETNQLTYNLLIDGSKGGISTGGTSYQLSSYRFWRITYYSKYERWEIVDDNGIISSYGGQNSSSKGSIDWAVVWNNNDISWQGPSSNTVGQKQIASVWRLESKKNHWNEQVLFEYNQDANGKSLQGSELSIGLNGKSFTKAAYLSKITDTFGRQAQFNYKSKLWGPNPSDIREFADPYTDTNPLELTSTAWQNKYEMLYLDSVNVQDIDGKTTLMSISLDYAPSKGNGTPCVNLVSGIEGNQVGDLQKRFLTGITVQSGEGDAAPSLNFDYFFEESENDGSSLGALKSAHHPMGGLVSYGYTKNQLNINRQLTVDSSGSNFKPSIWSGSDYTVLAWLNSSEIYLSVYTWTGQWVTWKPNEQGTIYNNSGGYGQLTVQTKADYFAVALEQDGKTDVWIFRKDITQNGQWEEAPNLNQVPDSGASLSYNSSTPFSLQGGDHFLIFMQDSKYDLVTWNWATNSWQYQGEQILDDDFLVVANNEYYALLDNSEGQITLNYLASNDTWQQGAPKSIDKWEKNHTRESISIAPGKSLLAITIDAGSNHDQGLYKYNIYVIQWDDSYKPITQYSNYFEDQLRGHVTVSLTPTIVDDYLVGVLARVLRYDGAQWQMEQLDNGKAETANAIYFAYGPDYLLQLTEADNSLSGAMLAFDADSLSYTSQNEQDGNYSGEQDIWPKSGGTNYLMMGWNLYTRGTNTSWANTFSQKAPIDLLALTKSALQTKSIDNPTDLNIYGELAIVDDPNYVAFMISYRNGGPNEFAIMTATLLNGNVSEQELFSTEKYPSQQDYSGQPIPSTNTSYSAGALVTFPSSDTFESASSLNLRKYSADSINGSIEHRAIQQISMANGFEDNSYVKFFDYNIQTATSDQMANVIKYHQVGIGEVGKSQLAVIQSPTLQNLTIPYGKTEKYYLNGNGVINGMNFYDVMDGLEWKTETYDSKSELISSHESVWAGFNQVGSDPVNNGADIYINGTYILKTSETQIFEGISTIKTISYSQDSKAPFSGLPKLITKQGYGGSGQQEVSTQYHQYTFEHNDTYLLLNILSSMAQEKHTWRPENSQDEVMVKCKASTFKNWSTNNDGALMAVEAKFDWNGSVSDGDFPYSSYQPDSNPNGWTLHTRTLNRAEYGQILSSEDVRGLKTSVLLAQGTYPVAKFIGSDVNVGESIFHAFESYEDSSLLTQANTEVIQTDAAFGSASLSMKTKGSVSFSINVTPGTDNYFVGCWVKADSVKINAKVLSWSITPYINNTAQKVVFADFNKDQNGWQYQTTGMSIAEGVTKFVIEAVNESDVMINIDGLVSMPVDATVKGKTYDIQSMLTTAQVSGDGALKRHRYDRFHRLIGSTKTSCEWEELQLRFLSRSVAQKFNVDSPNCRIRMTSPGGGQLETFIDGGDWENRWEVSNAGTNWKTSNGVLSHTASVNDTLSWKGWSTTPETATVFFQLKNIEEVSGSIVIQFGDKYSVSYSKVNGYQLLDPKSKVLQSALYPVNGVASQWFLICLNGTVVFVADGQVVLSMDLNYGTASGFTIETGPNSFAISDLSIIANPRLASLFTDGLGLERQKQELWMLNGKSDARTEQSIYNSVQHRLVKTKKAPARFGSGANQPLFTYRSGFCDIATFLTSQDNSLMGDVNDYYQGQMEPNGNSIRSNDEGYPYHGLAYEDSPLARVVEEGQPGKLYAIDTQVEETDRSTVQMTYTNNAPEFGTLPADEYKVLSMLSPTKTQTNSLTDFEGKILGNSVIKDQVIASQALAISTPNGAQSVVNMQLPNAMGTSDIQAETDFQASVNINPMGRKTGQTLPSTGENIYMEDSSNKLRFVLSGYGTNGSGWVYNKYDRMGRLTESGVLTGSWTQQTLTPYLEQNNWPDQSSDYSITRRLQYDGNGEDYSQLGKLITSATFNRFDKGDVTVIENYTYDFEGRKASQSTAIEGMFLESGSYSINYNNQNEIVQINYPKGCAIESVYYTFDESGKMVAIGTKAGGSDLATISYDAQGYLSALNRNNGNLKTVYSYNSVGWLLTQNDLNVSNSLLKLEYTYYSDGRPETRTTSYNGGAGIEEAFMYNAQNGLIQTSVQGDQLGNEQITKMDPNGNILAITQDGTDSVFEIASGSDRLSSVTVGGQNIPVAFDNDGWMRTYNDLTITHDIVLRKTSTLSNISGKWLYAYGNSHGKMVTVDTSNSFNNVFSIIRPDGKSLAVQKNKSWKQNIWGPAGLLLTNNGSNYFPLNDKLGSVLSVLDKENKVVGKYRYRPFGQLIKSESQISDIIGPTFMLQELDTVTGLYDFHSRLYDPVTRRFLSPDPALQYASPYVFVGNDPLSLTDPSGQLSVWGQALVLLGNVAVWAVGAVLAPETGGASVSAAEGASDAIDAVGTSVEGAGAAAKVAGQAAAKEEGASAIFKGIASNALKGAGIGGGLYVVMTPHDQINWSDYGSSVLWGAIGGATSFGMDKAFESLYSGLKNMVPNFAKSIEGKFSESLITKLGIGFKDAVEYDVNTVIRNVSTGHHWDDGLSTGQFLEKMGEGFALEVFGSLTKRTEFYRNFKKGDSDTVGKVYIAATVTGIGFVCWGGFAGFQVT